MSRRPATVLQADIRRCIRAAKAEGAAAVEVKIGASTITIRLTDSATQPPMENPWDKATAELEG